MQFLQVKVSLPPQSHYNTMPSQANLTYPKQVLDNVGDRVAWSTV